MREKREKDRERKETRKNERKKGEGQRKNKSKQVRKKERKKGEEQRKNKRKQKKKELKKDTILVITSFQKALSLFYITFYLAIDDRLSTLERLSLEIILKPSLICCA